MPTAAGASGDESERDSTGGDERQPGQVAQVDPHQQAESGGEPLTAPHQVRLGATAPRLPSSVVAHVGLQPRSAEAESHPRMVTLQVNAPDGSVARVRVALVGENVRATIVAEPAAASMLEAALPELHRALGDRGFHDSQLSIRTMVAEGSTPLAMRNPAGEGRSAEHQQQREPGDHSRWQGAREERSREHRRQSPDREGR